MYLIQVGHLTISLEHLILAEDSEKEPSPKSLPDGVLRITLEEGRVVDLRSALADHARRLIEQAVASGPARPASRKAKVGRSVDPATGREIVRGKREGVEGG